jgi:hypothetical protein
MMPSNPPARVPKPVSVSALVSLLAMSILLWAPSPLRAQESAPNKTHLLEVRISTEAELQRLAFQGVDIAGINRAAGTATVLAGDEEMARLISRGFQLARSEKRGPAPEALGDYKDPAEISAFLDQVQSQYPELARKVALTDPLYEGHVLYAMRITKDVGVENDRPSFLLDAQHHAREVMTPEIALDAVDYLTSRYATDAQVKRWVDSIDIWVVPTVNPDGAAYMFSSDTWWRRNRKPNCPVDLNRNYPFNWAACHGSEGSCTSDINRGPTAGSEPETRGMLALMGELRPVFHLSYHSYGQYILSPYGCYDPSEASVFEALGQNLNAILQDDSGQTGNYATGPGWSTIYQTDGTTLDTAYGLFGSAAFTIEVNSTGFQPDFSTWRNVTVQRQRTAWQYFLDRTLDESSVRGRIVDAITGEPVIATVSVTESPLIHGELPRQSDHSGRYVRLLEPGRTYHVNFEAPGYCAKTLSVDLGSGPSTLDTELDPSSAVAPGSPSPASGSKNRSLQVELAWEDTGAPSFQVYFGTTPDPPLAATVGAPSYAPTGLELSKTYYWRVGVSASCGSALSPVWSFSTYPYAITSAKKQGNPFRIVLTGQRFTGLCSVFAGETEVPNTSFKGESKLVAKGGAALKAIVPKGVPISLTVRDASGGSSAPFPFSW